MTMDANTNVHGPIDYEINCSKIVTVCSKYVMFVQNQVAHKTELSGTQAAVFTEIHLIGQFLARHYHPYLN